VYVDEQLADGVSLPPPQKQIDFATRLAEAAGESSTDEAIASKAACILYIDNQLAAGVSLTYTITKAI